MNKTSVEEGQMNYELLTIKDQYANGLVTRTKKENNQAITDIGNAWGKFFGEGHIEKLSHEGVIGLVGIYTEYESDYNGAYTFLCGTLSNKSMEIPGYTCHKILAGKYAKFSIHGDPQTVLAPVWKYIWESDLDRCYTSDFEVYHNDKNEKGHQTIEVFVALN